MNTDRVKNIVRETIEDFINEELSISDDVERYCNDICSQMLYLNRNDKYGFYEHRYLAIKQNDDDTIHVPYMIKVFSTKSILYKGIEIPCRITVIDFESFEMMMKYVTQVDEWGDNNFNSDMLNIKISVNSFDGRIDTHRLSESLHHEAEHAYQLLRMDRTTLMTDKTRYFKATSVLRDKIDLGQTEMKNRFKMVADLIYYYHHAELDAKINGLYAELMAGMSYQETEFKGLNDEKLGILNEFVEAYSDESYNEVMEYFGLEFDSFVKFIYRQQRYLMKKVRKVIMKVRNNQKNIIESVKVEKLYKTPLKYFVR